MLTFHIMFMYTYLSWTFIASQIFSLPFWKLENIIVLFHWHLLSGTRTKKCKHNGNGAHMSGYKLSRQLVNIGSLLFHNIVVYLLTNTGKQAHVWIARVDNHFHTRMCIIVVSHTNQIIFLVILAFDFCRFCVVIRFFNPRHNGQCPPTSKDFYTRSYPL